MTAAPRRGWTSFGQRAELERQGIVVDPEPPVEEPAPPPSGARVEITVTPVLDQEALVAVTEQIAAQVKAAVQLGITEGLAEADAMLTDAP